MHEKAILPRSQSHYGGKALKTMRFGSLLVDCHDTSAQGNAESAGTGPESTKVLNLKAETRFRRGYKFGILTAIQLCYIAASGGITKNLRFLNKSGFLTARGQRHAIG